MEYGVQIWKETGEGKAHVVFERKMSVLAEMQVPRLLQVMCFRFSPWQRLSSSMSQATEANNESSVLRSQGERKSADLRPGSLINLVTVAIGKDDAPESHVRVFSSILMKLFRNVN